MSVDGEATGVAPLQIQAQRTPLPLRPRSSADTTGEVSESLKILEEIGNPKLILRTLANSETAFRPFVRLTGQLLRSTHLPRPVLEVLILHMALRTGTNYELEEHVPMARAAGVPEQQIEALLRDSGAVDGSVFGERELLAVEFADTLLTQRRIELPLWERVVAQWGEAGGIDLILAVGAWGALVPTVIDALGLYHLG